MPSGHRLPTDNSQGGSKHQDAASLNQTGQTSKITPLSNFQPDEDDDDEDEGDINY